MMRSIWTAPHPLEAGAIDTARENIPDEMQRERFLDLRWRDQQDMDGEGQQQERLVPSRRYPHRCRARGKSEEGAVLGCERGMREVCAFLVGTPLRQLAKALEAHAQVAQQNACQGGASILDVVGWIVQKRLPRALLGLVRVLAFLLVKLFKHPTPTAVRTGPSHDALGRRARVDQDVPVNLLKRRFFLAQRATGDDGLCGIGQRREGGEVEKERIRVWCAGAKSGSARRRTRLEHRIAPFGLMTPIHGTRSATTDRFSSLHNPSLPPISSKPSSFCLRSLSVSHNSDLRRTCLRRGTGDGRLSSVERTETWKA